jgi:hemerythrin
MDKFIWTPEYSVGVQLIDEQHQHFFGIANKLAALAEEEDPKHDDLASLFGELGDYALYHLSTEESFFREFKYEDVSAHVAAHDAYREKVASHFTGVMSDPNVDIKKLADEMALYSGAWLQQHILVMDKKFTAFFNMHGFN